MLNEKNDSLGENSFRREGNTVFVRLSGKQTKPLAAKALADFKRLIAEVKAGGEEALVYVDLNDLKLEDVTVEARLAMKEAFKQPYKALAASGKTRLIEVAMYLINASGANKRVRYFLSEKKAMTWLHARQMSTTKPAARPLNRVVVALIIAAIGLIALLGWAFNNVYLTRIVPELRPINPMAAVGLILVSAGMIVQWLKMRRTTYVMVTLLLLLGLLALAPGSHLSFWLFGAQVQNYGVHANLANSAALIFVLIGLLLLLQDHFSARSRVAHAGIALSILCISLFNAFGLLYARDFMYSISPMFTMALPLSLAFIATSVGLAADMWQTRRNESILKNLSPISWLIGLVLVLVQILTYASWTQTNNQAQVAAATAFQTRISDVTNAATTRLRAYTDALNGFRGMYAASGYVTQGEFETYYNETHVTQNYPGVRAVSFIAKVANGELPAYVALHRGDTSQVPSGTKVTLQQLATSPTHYLVTYIAGTPTSPAIGTDLTNSPGRLPAFIKAEQTDQPVSSGTVTLGTENQKGFFVTVPVKYEPATAQAPVVGFVNVVFNYGDLFANILSDSSLTANLNTTITDTADAKTVIYSNNKAPSNTPLTLTQDVRIPAVDRTWLVRFAAPANFGFSKGQNNLPNTIIVAGQIFSVLLLIIFFIQNSARRRALLLANDITADLQQERNEAVATQKKDDTIFGGIAEGLMTTNKSGVITRINKAVTDTLGFSEKELVGKKVKDVLVAYDSKGQPIPDDNRPITRTIRTAKVIAELIKYQRKDGTMLDVQLTASPLILNGKVLGAIEVFRDVTKEQELERAKSEFVSLASHQLRTPLSAINWYAEMLLDGDMGKLTPDQQAQVQEIFDGNKRMVELVDSLLNVSRLEVGKLKNEPKDISLIEIADSLQREVTESIKVKNMDLQRKIQTDLPNVYADPKLVRMIIQNLLTNAIKYTAPQGTVVLTMREANRGDVAEAKLPANQAYIFISVGDNGYGIPKAEQDKIFGKLYRADNVRKLDVEGTGLGLYIVKEVVEMLGGHIWFTSTEHVGTTFFVVIPVTTKASQ